MAVAQQVQAGRDRGRAVAIIGDGALTGGMAFEGSTTAATPTPLHRRPQRQRDVDRAERRCPQQVPRPGSGRAQVPPGQERAGRDDGELPQGELLVELGKRWKDSFKEFVYNVMIWEELGFTYTGPVDGHDIRATVDALRNACRVDGPSSSTS
jgi:1-deoxy-D-xylulose-5-phosphate synthase